MKIDAVKSMVELCRKVRNELINEFNLFQDKSSTEYDVEVTLYPNSEMPLLLISILGCVARIQVRLNRHNKESKKYDTDVLEFDLENNVNHALYTASLMVSENDWNSDIAPQSQSGDSTFFEAGFAMQLNPTISHLQQLWIQSETVTEVDLVFWLCRTVCDDGIAISKPNKPKPFWSAFYHFENGKLSEEEIHQLKLYSQKWHDILGEKWNQNLRSQINESNIDFITQLL